MCVFAIRYGMFASISFVVKEGIVQHLPIVIPCMMESLRSEEGVKVTNSDYPCLCEYLIIST